MVVREGSRAERLQRCRFVCLSRSSSGRAHSVKESLRKTKRHVTIQSRLGTVPSLIRHSLPILKSLLVDQSVRANEALPWLPVGLLLLVAVSLLHNTLAWEAVWAAWEDIIIELLSNTILPITGDDLTCSAFDRLLPVVACAMGSESADSFPSSCNQKHLFTRLLILETNDTKDCPRYEKVLVMSSHYWRVLPADSLRWTAIHHSSRGYLWLQEYIFSKKHSNPANDYLKAIHHRRIRVDIWYDINIAQLI